MSGETQSDGISVSFLSVGNADWLNKVVIPLMDNIGELAPQHAGEIPPPLHRLEKKSGVVNAHWTAAPLIFGVTLIVSTLGAKVLGDFYDVVIKKRLRKYFKDLDKKLDGTNSRNPKVFNSSIWYQEFEVLVSVSVIGKSMAEIEAQMDLVDEVHSNARNWIAEHNASAPVHHYKIEAGKVNAQPFLAEHLDEAIKW